MKKGQRKSGAEFGDAHENFALYPIIPFVFRWPAEVCPMLMFTKNEFSGRTQQFCNLHRALILIF